jgi:pyruvate dehydrogenase (quinone)
LHRAEDRSFQEKLIGEMEDWGRLMEDRGQPEDHDGRIRPQALFAAISRNLPDNAIISSDSGSAANWFARHVRVRRGMKASLSGNLATMVPGVPYAIAAKFAFPDRVSVAMVGDGAMQMGGMAEMLTAAKYYTSWTDPRLVVLVLNNEDLNQVTWEQRVMEGDPRFAASQDIPYVAFHEYAELIGLKGIRVDRSSDIDGAVREAFAADRPVIIDARTDPEEAPLPPHITLKQAKGFSASVLKDPADGIAGAVESMREKLDEFVPGR